MGDGETVRKLVASCQRFLDPGAAGGRRQRVLTNAKTPPLSSRASSDSKSFMTKSRSSSGTPFRAYGASAADWRDWRWQLRHMADRAQIARVLRLTDDERAGLAVASFPVGATPYYLSLADRDDAFCPVRMQLVPRAAEARAAPGELADPLGEAADAPVPGLIHRYPDRVLFLATDRCSAYCRHCTRRRRFPLGAAACGEAALARAVAYVRAHREVRDVIVSGGDPLLLSTARLSAVLRAFRTIRHVEILRVARPARRSWTAGSRSRTRRCCFAGSTRARASSPICSSSCLPAVYAPTTCTRWTSPRAWSTCARRWSRAWRYSRRCGASPRGSRCRTSRWICPGAAARSACSPRYRYPQPEERDCSCPYEAKYYRD